MVRRTTDEGPMTTDERQTTNDHGEPNNLSI